MDEKKSVNIGFSTVVIILLMAVIVVMAYFLYINYNEKNEKDKKITELNSEISTLQSSVKDLQGKMNTISDTINQGIENNTSKLNLGKYIVQVNKEIYDPGMSYDDIGISFLENNQFEAIIEGAVISGTYTISDDMVNCTFKDIITEHETKEDIEGTITFKITEGDTVQVVNASEKIKIHVSDLDSNGKWSLTDETKDLEIGPYKKDMIFKLSK